jgi:hypothetical protein
VAAAVAELKKYSCREISSGVLLQSKMEDPAVLG